MTTSQLGFLDAFATFPLPGIARCTLLRGIQGPLQVPNAVSREFPPPMSLASEVFYQLSLSHPQSSGSHQCPFFNHKSHWSTVLFYYCFRFFFEGVGEIVDYMHGMSVWRICICVCKCTCLDQTGISDVLLDPLDLIPLRQCLSLNMELGWLLASPGSMSPHFQQ